MKVTFITTVLNEEKTVIPFLESLSRQGRQADEIIIVDGGSTDQTFDKIKDYRLKVNRKIKLFKKKGNRSVGRNEAMKYAKGEIIVISDAGCIIDKNWIYEIVKPFENDSVDVVAGYYKGLGRTVFQKCLIPYVLVMNDKTNNKNFLPATRSMAIKKSVWKKLNGFDEKLSHNEDYEFAKRLKKNNMNIIFVKKAIVFWIPGKTFKEAFIMFYRFAFGDSEAEIFRPKMIFIFLRYIAGIIIFMLTFFKKSYFFFIMLSILGIFYLFWAIWKNYRYIKHPKAIFYLPLLQITSDIAVIMGTIKGLSK